MENAADALKMAAWVLIFVVALSIIINAFGIARQTTDILISYNDNEYYTDYVEQGNTERKVGYETIIPAIYRAYKENYKIIFLNNDGTPMYFYENKNTEENISSVQSNRSYSNNIFPFSFDFNGFSNSDDPIIDIFGIKLYLDDIIILCLLFILYKEDVKDEMLFIALILLLLN